MWPREAIPTTIAVPNVAASINIANAITAIIVEDFTSITFFNSDCTNVKAIRPPIPAIKVMTR
jgi:hypothetical protein